MRQYPQHCDCIVCGYYRALYAFMRADAKPVYHCDNCGSMFVLTAPKPTVIPRLKQKK